MRRVLAALLILTGCAAPAADNSLQSATGGPDTLISTAPALEIPVIQIPPAAPPPPPPVLIDLPPDTCGARPLQYLVGQSRTEIPVATDLSRRRVTCTTCPVTRDFRADRLNILFDEDSGVIREVSCG